MATARTARDGDDAAPRDRLVARIRPLLAERETRETSMFGTIAFMVDEAMVVTAGKEGELLVRVDPSEHATLVARGGEDSVMGKGSKARPMGEGWITVPADRITAADELAFWVRTALAYRDRG